MSNVVAFQRILVAHDVNGGLLAEVMAFLEKAAEYLDGPARTAGYTGTAAVGHAMSSMRLTTRTLDMASVMLAARAWIDGDVHAADVRAKTGARNLEEASGVWWHAATPEPLAELCREAARLAKRVAQAQRNLIRAIEAEAAA